jgi:CheY-like chemotaxis protein
LRRIAASVKPAAKTRRILVVEDNPDECRAMAQALERAGFPVVCAASISEAMKQVEADGKLLAAIVDIKLPDASGGLVVWQLRRRFCKDLPVAVVTGMHNPHADYDLSRDPPDRLFPKPLDVDQLLAWVHEVRAGA